MVVLDPQIADRYEVLDKIREGGMGAIYRVRHRLLDEVRVVKVIRAAHPTPAARARFLQEARAATRLRHPNVAVLHDFAVAPDGNALIVLEYIEGWSLLELLREAGPPPLPLTLEIARQALKALGYLHRQSIVHRDISPDNLMLTRDVDGQPLVKLIDLGIAKTLASPGEFLGPAGNRGLTTEGAFLGKPRYAAPEQFESAGASLQSDLYSFAAVLYELLTGEPPVRGTDLASYMAAHLLQPPVPFEESDPAGRVPEELRAVVLQALAKRPADRPADAAAFARALTAIQVRHPLVLEDFEAVLAFLRPPAAVAELRLPGSTSEHIDRRFGRATVAGAPALPADLPLRNEETRRVTRLVPAETLGWRPPAPALPAAAPEPAQDPGPGQRQPSALESEEDAWARWDLSMPDPAPSAPAPPAGEAGDGPGAAREEDSWGSRPVRTAERTPAVPGPARVRRLEPSLAVPVPFTGPAEDRGAKSRTALFAAAAILLVVAGGAGWQVVGRREAAAVAQATAPAAGGFEAPQPAEPAPSSAPALPSPAPAPPEPAAPPPSGAQPLEADGSGGPLAEIAEIAESGKAVVAKHTPTRTPAGTESAPAAAEPAAAKSEAPSPAVSKSAASRERDKDGEPAGEARTAAGRRAGSPGREERSTAPAAGASPLARKPPEPTGSTRRESAATSREPAARKEKKPAARKEKEPAAPKEKKPAARTEKEPIARKAPVETWTEPPPAEPSRTAPPAPSKPSTRDREPESWRTDRAPRPTAPRPDSSWRSSPSPSYRRARPPRRGDFFLGGRDVSSPVPLAMPVYDYPARARGWGTVSVRVALLVDEDGMVMEANIREGGPLGQGFDEVALAAAWRTRFQPAYRGDVAGKMWTEMIFVFVE